MKSQLITYEEFVPPLEEVDIIGPLVDNLIEAPLGAAPTSCHPLYPMDGESVLEYTEQVSDPESFKAYVTRWLDI